MNTLEPISDYRARFERLQAESAERNARAMIDQRAPENSPEVRVRIWERLHQLRLPKSPAHAILAQVAKQTALDISQVLEVQRVRALPPVVAAP
jgi:hypothetical protein